MTSEAGLAGGEGSVGEEEDEEQRQMTLLLSMNDEANSFDGRMCFGHSHLIESIIEEIALEGLDGITFQALKIRLDQGQKFEIEDFENIAPAIWRQLKYCKNIKFYLLPKSRTDLVKYRWDERRDSRGHVVEQYHSPEEIYTYHPVEDKQRGIRGSCEYYHTRKDISQLCRKSSYAQILNGFGNRLVLVANQYLREQALLGPNYKKYEKLTIIQYCIMERIGRSRNHGEVTRGKISLSCLKIEPKALFYHRKFLLQSGLITRQASSLKFASSKCPALISVFHLPRFYKRMESAVSVNTRIIFSWLNKSPTKSVPIKKITAKFNKRTLQDLKAQFPTLLQTAWEKPDVKQVESSDLEEGTEKITKNVRILRLLEEDTTVQNEAISKFFSDNTSCLGDDNNSTKTAGHDEIGENQEEIEQVINISNAASYSDVVALRPGQQLITSTNFLSICHLIIRAGIGGLTIRDIANIMNFTKLDSRGCSNFLVRHNICEKKVVKIHKVKAFTFIFTNFVLRDAEIKTLLQDKFEAAMIQIERVRKQESKSQRQRINSLKSKGNKSSQKPNVNDENTADESSTGLQVYSPRQSSQQASNGTTQALPLSDLKNESNQLEVIKNELEQLAAVKEGTEAQVIDTNDRFIKNKIISNDRELFSVSFSDDMDSVRVQEEPEENTRPKIMPSELGTGTCAASSLTTTSPDNNTLIKEFLQSLQSMSKATNVGDSKETEHAEANNSKPFGNTGIQSREDSIDKSIRQKATRQRVKWTPSEDHILLVAYIASCMFIPRYALDRIFMHNPSEIRDIMLIKADGNSDKTSTTIKRRLQFLVRQKSYFNWYVQHVSQAVRDNVLYEDYVKNYIPAPQYKIYFSPPFEVLESVVDYLLIKFDDTATTSVVVDNQSYNNCNGDVVIPSPPTSSRSHLTGLDTLLFLRELKRAEFYWNGILFAIFCSMGDDTPVARGEFISKWKAFANRSKNTDKNDLVDDDNDFCEGMPVFEMEELKEVQMQVNNGVENRPTPTPQEQFLDFCWKFLKFITKKCNIMFNNILMIDSLPTQGFQIVSFDRKMNIETTNICSCQRECNSQSEVRHWSARNLLLDQIFSGGDCGEQVSKNDRTKSRRKKGKLPLERATRSLLRARVLVSRKNTKTLKLNKTHLKSFMEGLPAYSYGEMWDLLRYLDEECHKVDVLACLCPGMLTGILELTDYWTARITSTEPIFTVRKECMPSSPSPVESAGEKVMGTSLPSSMSESSDEKLKMTELGPPKKKKKANPTPLSKGKKRKRGAKGSSKKAKRRKTKKEDKIVNEVAEFFEDLSVNGDHPQPPSILNGENVGLEEGENYLCSSVDMLKIIHLHPSFTGRSSNVAPTTSQVMDDNDVNINFPTLELEFSRKTFALNHSIVGSSHPFSLDALKELRQGLLELVYYNSSPSSAGTNDKSAGLAATSSTTKIQNLSKYLNKYSVLFDLIRIAGAVGVSGAFLETEFERKSLRKGLQYLLDARLIFGVGVVHRRFVSFNNVKDWIIPIRSQTDAQVVVGHVILRPWITAVGGISWKTISRLFTALIGQMQKPSTRLNDLCQIFTPILSPVEALVLIESLAKLKYLMLYKFQEPKVTLFSKHPIDKCDIEYNADTLIDTKNVFVAISPYLTTLHAQLQHALQKTSKKKQVST